MLCAEGFTMGALATLNERNPNAAHAAPLGKSSTNTCNGPIFAICAAVTTTLNCVGLMNLGVRNVPPTETSDVALNPVPFRVRVKPGPPATAAAGLRLVSVSGVAVVL